MSTEPTRPSIIASATLALGAQVAVYVLAFLSTVIIARALGPSARGVYYLPVTGAAVAVALFNAGVESANSVMYAERRHSLDQLMRNASALALVLAPIAMTGLALAYVLGQDSFFDGVDSTELCLG